MMKLSSILKFVFQNILRIKSFLLRNLNVSGNQMSSVDSFIRRFKYSVNGDNNLMTLNSVWGTNISIIIDGKGNQIFLSGEARNCSFEIYGDNNVVELFDIKYQGVKFIIRGNDCKIHIGQHSSCGGGRFVVMGKSNEIFIGKDCQFADNIEIWATDSHPILISDKVINPNKPVAIGNHVWLGAYVKILKGVTIEDNAIVGMNSVVTRPIKSKTLNVGYPAQCIKENVDWNRNFLI